jgi:hypothetical protein
MIQYFITLDAGDPAAGTKAERRCVARGDFPRLSFGGIRALWSDA